VNSGALNTLTMTITAPYPYIHYTTQRISR